MEAAAIVAIDENVRRSLPTTLDVQVIHNSFSVSKGSRDAKLLKLIQGIRPEAFTVGFVGNLLRVKGLFDLVEQLVSFRKKTSILGTL